jgi:hypothetical protein
MNLLLKIFDFLIIISICILIIINFKSIYVNIQDIKYKKIKYKKVIQMYKEKYEGEENDD